MNKFKLTCLGLLSFLTACSTQINSPEQNATGILTLGHEVYSFKYQGKDYWLIDKSGDLMSTYQQVTKSDVANYQPIAAVLQVKELDKMTDGFGADYDGTFQVEKIITLTSLKDFVIGDWTEVISGNPSSFQGFSLKKDGTAHSINTATLQYSKWEIDKDKLTLFGKSIGNGQSIDFKEVYVIDALDEDSIWLTGNNSVRHMKRIYF